MKPYPMSPLQSAYWTAQHLGFGSIRSHLYLEFDGHGIHLAHLQAAFEQVISRHGVFRMRVSKHGEAGFVLCPAAAELIDIDEMTDLTQEEIDRCLEHKRIHGASQWHDLTVEGPLKLSITLLPNGAFRMHVDVDMLLIDPPSAIKVVEELAHCYLCKLAGTDIGVAPDSPPSFTDWIARLSVIENSYRDKDAKWWREFMRELSEAPHLPRPADDRNGRDPNSRSISTGLGPMTRDALQTLARNAGVTESAIALAVFSFVIAQATGQDRFRIAMPSFWRRPIVDKVEDIIGEFANVLIVDINLKEQNCLAAMANSLWCQLMSQASHDGWTGVEALREYSREKRSIQSCPVVFTSGLGIDKEDLVSRKVTQAFGNLVHTISQSDGVILDAQIASLSGRLFVNWDVRIDLVDQAWVEALFADYVHLLDILISDHEMLRKAFDEMKLLDVKTSSLHMKRGGFERLVKRSKIKPLSLLQRSYLLGRTNQFPLGGLPCRISENSEGSWMFMG